MHDFRPSSEPFCRSCRLRVGALAATCGSIPAGPRPMPAKFADTQRNWPRSRRTSSWPMAPRPWGRCCRRPAPCRLCPRCLAIQSVPVSLTAWRGNATGFMSWEYGMAGKWLELLKETVPSVTRAAVLRDPSRDKPVCRHPSRGTVAQGGGQPRQHARRRGDRARRCGLRALPEWRSNHDGEWGCVPSSRSDHHACGAT